MNYKYKNVFMFIVCATIFINPFASALSISSYDYDAPNASRIITANESYIIYNTEHDNLCSLNLKTSETTDWGKIIPSVSFQPVVLYKNNVIVFNTIANTLMALDLVSKKTSWSLILANNFFRWGTVVPVISSNAILIYINNGLVKIDAVSGDVISPKDFDYKKNNSVDCVCNIIDKTLIVATSTDLRFIDISNGDQLPFTISRKPRSEPVRTINNYIFKHNGNYYIQNNAVTGQGLENSFLDEVEIFSKHTINQYQNQYASGIWLDSNFAYIFPFFDKEIIRFDLDTKTSTYLKAPNFYSPLGIYKSHLFYCSKNSIIKCDLDGKLVEETKLGKITYDNCKMFNDKIYYVDGEKLKIINLEEAEAKPPPPFDLISWFIRFILGKLLGTP